MRRRPRPRGGGFFRGGGPPRGGGPHRGDPGLRCCVGGAGRVLGRAVHDSPHPDDQQKRYQQTPQDDRKSRPPVRAAEVRLLPSRAKRRPVIGRHVPRGDLSRCGVLRREWLHGLWGRGVHHRGLGVPLGVETTWRPGLLIWAPRHLPSFMGNRYELRHSPDSRVRVSEFWFTDSAGDPAPRPAHGSRLDR